MKQVTFVIAFVFASFVGFSQSFGGFLGGAIRPASKKSASDICWGGWVDFGKVGFYHSVAGGIDLNADSYISGTTNKHETGWVSRNYGLYFNTKSNFFIGFGLQRDRTIGVEDKTVYTSAFNNTYSITVPTVYDKTSMLPYIQFGGMTNFGNENSPIVGRIETVIGKTSSINVGIGINLGKGKKQEVISSNTKKYRPSFTDKNNNIFE